MVFKRKRQQTTNNNANNTNNNAANNNNNAVNNSNAANDNIAPVAWGPPLWPWFAWPRNVNDDNNDNNVK